MTATPTDLDADPECAELHLDHTGLTSARDSSGRDSSNACWRR
jgi:hypothetical protein